jgi:hypothetical protein
MARGEVRAITGDTDGALADWLRALEIDADHIGLVYSTALLEPAGRPAEAIAVWRFIVACNQARGDALQAAWPRRELVRPTESLGAEGTA